MPSSFRLHSRYNPQREADNFANTVSGSPLYIVITEPGESYLATSFRKRFPCAKIFAIRYTDSLFLDSDSLFDAVWRGKPDGIPFFLINHIPDEYFSRCVFLSWLASENVWQQEAKAVWSEIKKASEIFLSIINTRSFFGKTWLKNIFRNLIFANKVTKVDLKAMEKPSFFLTSGTSLEELIKDGQVRNVLNHSFTLASSSSLSSLMHHGVKPSCAIATDGGFWAEPHLKCLQDVPLLFPLEARIPYAVLEHAALGFISYGSMLENYFFDVLKIPYLLAKRNGTVAGSGIELLLEYTKGEIYISGLDLSFSNGFTHARPNENMQTNLVCDGRLNPSSSILAHSQFSHLSLSTYASWFSSMNEQKKIRLRRIGEAGLDIEGVERVRKEELSSLVTQREDIVIMEVEVARDERRMEMLAFLDKMETNIRYDDFFDALVTTNEKTVERDVCELLAFSDYIALLKNTEADDGCACGKNEEGRKEKEMSIAKSKQLMREKVLHFIEKEKRIIREIMKCGE